MMKKILMVAMLAAVVAVPAGLAATPAQAPSAYCKANTLLIGAGKTYATFGACVSKQAALANANRVNAAKACKAEQADPAFATNHGGRTFDQFYGTNGATGKGKSDSGGNGNALGNCVSQKANEKTAQQQQTQVNAAKKCRTAELKAVTGPGKTYKNFGACVSAQAKLAQS